MANDKPSETTKHTLPQGAQPPAGQTYETPEPKRRADEATGRPEPSAHPERAPQDQPGYEAKQKAEEAKHKPKNDEHKQDPDHKPGPRSHAARRKPEVKHAVVRKPLRKHK